MPTEPAPARDGSMPSNRPGIQAIRRSHSKSHGPLEKAQLAQGFERPGALGVPDL